MSDTFLKNFSELLNPLMILNKILQGKPLIRTLNMLKWSRREMKHHPMYRITLFNAIGLGVFRMCSDIAALTRKPWAVLDGVKALKQILARQKKKFTVSVEGNIGCGKSTLLKYFESCPTVECIKEPVDKWVNLKGHNALQKLYEDPARWSFSFNSYAYLTRLEMHKHRPSVPVKMLERSMQSSRFVFVENLYQSGDVTKLEYSILCEQFDHFAATEDIGVDLFVYLRAPPEICHERIKMRNRKEEAGVPFEFIEKLHKLHEEWLIEKKYDVPAEVLVLDASVDIPQMTQMYEDYKSEILCGCT